MSSHSPGRLAPKAVSLSVIVAALGFFVAGAILGCSSNGDPAAPGTGDGAASGNDTGSSGETGVDAGPTDATQDDGGATGSDSGGGQSDSAVADCTTYCAGIMATCTGGDAQYHDLQRCQSACPLFAKGSASDTSGNTLGCRMHYLGVAANTPNPDCWHAGPFGYGGCGGACEDFCALAVDWCSPANGYTGALPYASLSDCLTTCAGYAEVDTANGAFGVDGGWFGWGPFGGNTLDCRETHLGNALDCTSGGAAQQFHCTHVQKTPPGGQCLQ
jgi:hypothetical protein